MLTFFDKLLTCEGWRRVGLMWLLGAMAALAHAPFFLWFLLPLSYGMWLAVLLRQDSPKRGFILSWWWGFGFFLVGLYWICISMTVDILRFGWMIPFALFGFNGALALFMALAGAVFVRLKPRITLLRWLLFVALVTAAEWLRSNLFTGFPWNIPAYVWGALDASIQLAALLPIHALGAITLLLASASAFWLKRWPILLSAALFAACLGWGKMQLPDDDSGASWQAPTSMRLVQGNVPQHFKHNKELARELFQIHINLSAGSDAAYVIWPESAVPYTFDWQEPFPHHAFEWLKEGQILITGAAIYERDADRYTNSIIAIRGGEGVAARFDKQHLVPFGEYAPLRGILPVEKIVPGRQDFSAGEGVRRLMGFVPLICYEVIFPAYAKDAAAESVMLLNLTNDDWFGNSSGPYQHLLKARFRAVENRKPLLRVANSGISAVIDPYGRVTQSLPLGVRGVIDLP
jgi:apolipoprotein N-acyltransferase